MRMQPDGTGLEIHASGIRNTVGFDLGFAWVIPDLGALPPVSS